MRDVSDGGTREAYKKAGSAYGVVILECMEVYEKRHLERSCDSSIS